MAKIRFGIQTPQEGATYDALASHWREADALGFDTVWLDDHFYAVVRPPASRRWKRWTLLAALARETQRIEIGSWSPATLSARPRWSRRWRQPVDVISTGASSTAWGRWFQSEYEGLRLRVPAGRRRLAISSARGLHVQKLLWSEEQATFKGKFYKLQTRGAAEAGPRPHPPILLGAAASRCCSASSRAMPTSGTTAERLDDFSTSSRCFAALRQGERPYDAIEKSWFGNVIVDADAGRARLASSASRTRGA
jgi:alkanesulfonate monooxygenase SsuD/methylene tetrahydromethanopterin reductase-like flavin-dependent oxidoreductase (luciferase family)